MGRTFPKFFPYEKFPAIRYTGEMSPVALKSNVGGKKHDWTLKDNNELLFGINSTGNAVGVK